MSAARTSSAPHNKIVIENSQEGNDHLVSILRPSAVRLLLAAGTTDITAHSTVEVGDVHYVLCPPPLSNTIEFVAE